MNKLKMQTPDITDKNIEQIAKLFPNVMTEIKDEAGNSKKAIDFDLLKQSLSDVLVDDENERYRLDWPGKKASLLKANTPIAKTLRPVREESVNFDTTENVYIEGDNFEVLKILQESYLSKIKMIYIDPPYNTGKDFIYKDDFKVSKEEYEEEIGAVGEDGAKLFKNTDSNGRFHSDWLSMMYERLLVARDLLKDDGVILRKKKTNGNNMGYIPPVHDYFLCYAKSVSDNCLLGFPLGKDFIQKNYTNPDNDTRGAWTTSDLSANHKGPCFPINTVFIVQTNALIACFDDNINFKIVDEIADLKPFKVVFKDAGFSDDKDRINLEERFKRLSPETVITIL